MAVRREQVILELQDNFTAGIARAAAATTLLDEKVNHLGGTTTNTDRDLKKVGQTSDQVGQSVSRTGSKVEAASKQWSLLADAAITLGPALVPLGATTIPVLTTALAGLGAASSGIGTAILAFHGLGNAIKAVDTYKLAPTVENLAKLRAEQQKFGPAGIQFANYLSGLEPELRSLQNIARAGLFPGIEDGIQQLLTSLPQVKRVLRGVSTGMGDLAREGAAALTSDKFSHFFAYIKSDAEPTLVAFAKASGNVAETFANLLVAFAPLTRQFTGGLVGATAALARWSEELSANNSFQSFLTYVETSGPKVLALLGSLAKTFASIVEAAAPIGANLLPVLTQVSDLIGAIARSDLGTPILAGLIALRLFSRAQQGIGEIAGSSFGKVVTGQKEVTLGFGKAGAAARQFGGDLQNVARYGALATESTRRLKGNLATFGKAGAAVAGVALATSGLADKFGLGHTASLALIGSLAGPEGAVAGGLIGAALDLKSANDKAAASQQALARVMAQSPADFAAQGAAWDTARQKSAAFAAQSQKDADTLSQGGFILGNVFKPSVWEAFGRSVEHGLGIGNAAMDDSAAKAEAVAVRIQAAVATIARGTGDKSVPPAEAFQQGQAGNIDTINGPGQDAASLTALTAAASRLQPTLSALGITFDQLGKQTPAQLQATIAAIKAYNTQADSTRSKNQAVAAAFQALNNEMASTSESAGQVADSLDALLNPKLSLSAATDAWNAGLRHLKDNLDKTSRSLTANTDAGDKNRAAIRDQESNLVAMLDAQAKAGAGTGKLTRSLQAGREALIKQGEAAGFSKSQMVSFLNELGLTPALVKTVIQANTSQAQGAVDRLLNGINSLHDRTVTIRMNTVHTDSSGVSYQHGGGKHSADGSTVPKGGTYADRYLYLLAPGEEVISNRYGQADRHRDLLKAINAGRMAGGGTAGGHSGNVGSIPGPGNNQLFLAFVNGVDTATSSLKSLHIAADAEAKALDKAKTRLGNIRSAEGSLTSTVSSSFGLDSVFNLSAASGNPWAGGASGGSFNPTANLNAITSQANQFIADVKTLQSNGVKGAALQAILSQGPTVVHAMAQMSPADLSAEVSAFTAASAAVAQASSLAGTAIYGQQETAAVKELKGIRKDLHVLNQAVKAGDKANQKGHKSTAQAAANSGTKAAAHARRRAKAGG